MTKEDRRQYVFAQLRSLPNAFQYVEVTEYIKEIEQDKDVLIKHLENSIKELKKAQRILYENMNTKLVEKATVNSAIRSYQDILERIKNRNYE